MMEPITIKYETYKNPSGQLREGGERRRRTRPERKRDQARHYYKGREINRSKFNSLD
jgi:hypothetical protein